MIFKTNMVCTGDNLFYLKQFPKESVDMFYVDPLFNSRKTYTALSGSRAEGIAFKDFWDWEDVEDEIFWDVCSFNPLLARWLDPIEETHSLGMKAYLTMIARRVIEMHRCLKDTGTLYLHCDNTAAAYLKILLDIIFDKSNYKNQITWKRTTMPKVVYRSLPYDTDIIYRYCKTNDFIWNKEAMMVPYEESYIESQYKYIEKETNRRYSLNCLVDLANKVPSKKKSKRVYEIFGFTKKWVWSEKKMLEAIKKGIVIQPSAGRLPLYKKYLDEAQGKPLSSIWTDIKNISNRSKKDYTGYPTAKPTDLIKRLVELSTRPGDLIVDPFCGSGTSILAIEELNQETDLKRKWVAIDINPKVTQFLKARFEEEFGGLLLNTEIKIGYREQKELVEKEMNSLTKKKILYGKQQGRCIDCQKLILPNEIKAKHITEKGTDTTHIYCDHCCQLPKTKLSV